MTLTLGHLLTRSLLHRRARSLSALVALTVSAAITTALLTLYADLDSKLHREFRSFGANILITAPAGTALPPNALAIARQTAGPDTRIVPFAYAVVTTTGGTPVVLAGTDLASARILNTSWSIDDSPQTATSGTSPAGPAAGIFGSLRSGSSDLGSANAIPAAALIGAKVARTVTAATFQLSYNNHSVLSHSEGVLHTGGDEDSRIYTSLGTFTALTGSGPTVLELQVPGSRSRVNPPSLTSGAPSPASPSPRSVSSSRAKAVSSTAPTPLCSAP